jgi:AAA domain
MPTSTNPADSFVVRRTTAPPALPLLGRSRQLARLLDLIRAKTPALICGAPGLGKTRLLDEVASKLAADGIPFAYVRFEHSLHTLLIDIGRQMDLDIENASSVALRGALWQAFESTPRVILLDDIAEPSGAFYRFFERILAADGNTVVGVAVDMRAVGSLGRIFWNRQGTVLVQPLNKREAATLVESAIAAFAAASPISPDFTERVVQAARGNPGRIVNMCIRAADPSYRDAHDRIRFGALVTDSVMGLVR